MDILRVFNNNVVLARDAAGREVVVTGRGLGYKGRPGDVIDDTRVARIFLPLPGGDPDTYGSLIAEIPPEHIVIADLALASVRDELPDTAYQSVLVALADHLSFALKRMRQSIEIDYPLRAEVAHLFPKELRLATTIVDSFNAQSEVQLPREEAVPIALHLVNAGFATGDLSHTYQMTGVFKQLFEVIEGYYGRPFDFEGISAARFITHLRYFFVRMHNDSQLDEGRQELLSAVGGTYPDAFKCAARVKNILELRLASPITDDELLYLTMHIARLASDQVPVATGEGTSHA